MTDGLELPGPAARAHSATLVGRIRDAVAANGGWLDFSDYMRMALYEPGLGYYSAGSTKFGPAGDFVTAPEISPLFARCLARACVPTLSRLEAPVILEIGAGSGALACDVLDALAGLDCLPARYLILEVSAELRERQRALVVARAPGLAGRVEWLDRLPVEPLHGVVIANEVADALPVSRFRCTAEGVVALGVGLTGAALAWREGTAGAGLVLAVAAIEQALGEPLAPGYTSEVCLELPAWIGSVADSVAAGAIFLVDYGCTRREYYLPGRAAGTLVCHYRHRVHHDVFWFPGLQDITAWVDFSMLAAAGRSAGLALAGYGTQAHFLLDNGIESELASAAALGTSVGVQILQQAKTLLLPGDMGERFKVLALTRGDFRVPGFEFRDLSARL